MGHHHSWIERLALEDVFIFAGLVFWVWMVCVAIMRLLRDAAKQDIASERFEDIL